MQANGIITKQSNYTVKETIDRLESALKQKGITIYARINQQLEAQKGGMDINPLEFLLFGNPAKGGAVMAAEPLAALDLPIKLIAWQDAQRKTWVAYNEPGYVQARYGLTDQLAAVLNIDAVVTAVL